MIGPIAGVRLFDGYHSGHWFAPTDPGCRPRKGPVTSVVLHWTGGEGGNERIYATLQKRGLSIHFTVSQTGEVVQHADLTTVTSHAGGTMNECSIGIEIANAGFPPAHEKWPRQKIPARIHGRSVMTLGFYKAQTDAVLALVKHLCELQGLPFAVPRNADGSVIAGVMKRADRIAWKGVLGHLQISSDKCDPGIALLDMVR